MWVETFKIGRKRRRVAQMLNHRIAFRPKTIEKYGRWRTATHPKSQNIAIEPELNALSLRHADEFLRFRHSMDPRPL